jgi:hypothetical protein
MQNIMTRSEAVNRLQDVFRILNADLDEALAYGRSNPSPFAHRSLVRTHFAMIEGVSFQLRQITLASLIDTDFLTPEEIVLLREKRYSIDNTGSPKAQETFHSFLPNLLFSIRCYLKNHGALYTVNMTGDGWAAMQRAIKIRNRVTHPKNSESLELTTQDLKDFTDAAVWWKQTMLEMFSACSEADEYWRSKLQEV